MPGGNIDLAAVAKATTVEDGRQLGGEQKATWAQILSDVTGIADAAHSAAALTRQLIGWAHPPWR